MTARSAKGNAIRVRDHAAREQAREAVDAAKHALGERGDPWWTDGAPDYNRHFARNTPYAACRSPQIRNRHSSCQAPKHPPPALTPSS